MEENDEKLDRFLESVHTMLLHSIEQKIAELRDTLLRIPEPFRSDWLDQALKQGNLKATGAINFVLAK